MKIIFLDVDGVLNSEDDLKVYREKNHITKTILYDQVEDRPLKLLKEIVDKTSAKIVVSSSWRLGEIRREGNVILEDTSMVTLRSRLADYGMEVFDITPYIRHAQRGEEIEAWLISESCIICDEVIENFIILDDDSDMAKYLNTDHFIKTTYEHGLTEELKDKAIEFLNNKENKNMLWCNGLELEDWEDSHPDESIYLHGKCDEWVLQNYQEGDTVVVWYQFDDELEKDVLIHCYIIRNDKCYLDVRGITDNVNNVEEGFDYGPNSIRMYLESLDDYKNTIRNICNYTDDMWK